MGYVYSDIARPDILRMIPPDGRVIGSIGCGRAAIEHELVRQGREVHGVDIVPEAIDVAKTRITSARVISPDNITPFAPDSLDGLILADVIEHIPLAWNVLRAYTQAVRPGGWVVISVPNMRNLKTFKTFVWDGEWPEDETGIFDRTHLQVMTHRRLARWCAAANLKPEAWFTRYLSEGTPKERLIRAFDHLTLQTWHTWLITQLQVRCRVDKSHPKPPEAQTWPDRA